MKTSFVVASVLLAGVALEAAAFRINNNENSQKQWTRNQQGDSNEGSSVTFGQNGDQFQSNENRDQYNQKLNQNYYYNNENRDQYSQQLNYNNNNNNNNNENRDQYNQRLNHNNYNNFDSAEQRRYQSQNQVTVVDQSAVLTRKIVEKIAALQKIASDNNIAQRTEYFDNALSLDKAAIKLSEQDFVTFYNATAKHLADGELEYLCINPERDAVSAKYHFDRVETVGSFKSNVRGDSAGQFNVVMNGVSCNVTTGFDNEQHADVRPAQFRYADASLRNADGAETRLFDDALEHRYLGALKKAVSAEVARSANRGVIAQMKREIRKPAVFYGTEKNGKLFDMRWKEDDVSMEMPDVGFQNPENVAEPIQFSAVSFYRKSANVYRMLYHFTLNNLAWASPLTVESAGKRTGVRSANFHVGRVDVFVTVDKPYGQQRPCGQFNADVQVTGLRYDFDENVPFEFMTNVENKLQRFIEHSLENYVQKSLERELCQSNAQ